MGRPGSLTSGEGGMSLHKDTGVLDFVCSGTASLSAALPVQEGCLALLAERGLQQDEDSERR